MPQLNPAPWFGISMFSWAVLLTVVLPLILARTTANSPNAPDSQSTPKAHTWVWPWV